MPAAVHPILVDTDPDHYVLAFEKRGRAFLLSAVAEYALAHHSSTAPRWLMALANPLRGELAATFLDSLR